MLSRSKYKTVQLFKAVILLAIVTTTYSPSVAQDDSNIFGRWKTIDDNSGEPRSIVEIYEKNGKAYGKIVSLFREPGEDPDPICDECTDHRKDQKVIGMEIITAMEKDGSDWEGGEILDPENGNVYRCKIWRDGNELKVRGYIMFLFRTQTWLKAE